MSYNLRVNGVITGSLNCFCLACDVFLKSRHDATHHIQTSEHQKNAAAVQFFDKFPDEHIKKFKRGYYCEFCNVLMPVATKVEVHIIEDEHKHNKGILLLKPMGIDVVAFNNVLIEENAWHGFIEGICSLCNVEFEDENNHKADAGHSLNLVLKPIQFGYDNAIFRHLDNKAVQCLTCNKLLPLGRMSKHFDDTEHLKLYAKQYMETEKICQGTKAKENCQESKEAADMILLIENDDEINKPNIDNDANRHNKGEDKNDNEKSPTRDKSKILQSIAKYQTKEINITLETETAFCEKCSQVVTFDFMEIENHIENHSATAVDSELRDPTIVDEHLNRLVINDKTTGSSDDQHNEKVNHTLKQTLALQENVQENSSNNEDNETNPTCSVDDLGNSPSKNLEKGHQEQEQINFAKANNITYIGSNKQYFCRVCKVHFPASLRAMKEHVEGMNHKRIVASSKPFTTQPKTPTKLSKQKTVELVNTVYDVRTLFYSASMINEKFLILRNSFYLISENDSKMRCFLCDINLSPYLDDADHTKSSQHLFKWQKVPVITSERNEFIREVRPGLYHCGFCHLLVSGWTKMKRHLECSEHRDQRNTWELRFMEHLPGLQQHKMRDQPESVATPSIFSLFD